MKKLSKFILFTTLLSMIVVVIFFFWASSPTLSSKAYSELKEYETSLINENDSVFKVVTYNIGYLSGMTNNRAVIKPKKLFDDNLNLVISELKKENPSIISFQEIDYDADRSFNVNQEQEISQNLGYQYAANSINWDETYLPFPYWPPSVHFGKVLSGQSVISKHPIISQERVVLERVKENPFYREAFYLDRLAQVVKMLINKQEVVLINVHLEAFNSTTRRNQYKKVVSIFKKYAKEYPTILLGDFNSEARNKKGAIQELLSDKDVGCAAFNLEEIKNTFNSIQPDKRIDYIFFTKNTIQYLEGDVLERFGEASDHLPVAMSFKLK